MKNLKTALLIIISILVFAGTSYADDSRVSGKCMTCHKEKSPGLYNQWFDSDHAKHNVTCLDCHKASKSESDAYEHYGAYIATLVTPKDCGVCHQKEAKETECYKKSYWN